MIMAMRGDEELGVRAADLAGRLPEALAPLARIAYNYRWCWYPGGADVFRSIDVGRWELCGENPVRLLQEASGEALARAAADHALLDRVASLEDAFAADLRRPAGGARGAGAADRFFVRRVWRAPVVAESRRSCPPSMTATRTGSHTRGLTASAPRCARWLPPSAPGECSTTTSSGSTRRRQPPLEPTHAGIAGQVRGWQRAVRKPAVDTKGHRTTPDDWRISLQRILAAFAIGRGVRRPPKLLIAFASIASVPPGPNRRAPSARFPRRAGAYGRPNRHDPSVASAFARNAPAGDSSRGKAVVPAAELVAGCLPANAAVGRTAVFW